MATKDVVIIGAGPAGLTAGYELLRHGATATIVEADSMVGGLARTVDYKGYLCDIGGHRFFTKWPEVDELWHEILGEEFVETVTSGEDEGNEVRDQRVRQFAV